MADDGREGAVELARDVSAQACDGLHLVGLLELMFEAEALERLRGALGDPLEQRQLQRVEMLVVKSTDTDEQPGAARGIGSQREVANTQAEQIGSALGHSHSARQRLAADGLVEYGRRVRAEKPDAPDELRGRRAGGGDEHEADLGVVRLAQLARDDGSEVLLQASGIDQRDDLAASRSDQEATQQPVALVRRKRR